MSLKQRSTRPAVLLSASSHDLTALGDDLQRRETVVCRERESPSLLFHQDPQVRLRALACLYSHIDLLSQDSEGTERLFQALHSRLELEDNAHVTRQIVRLLTSLVISTCKSEVKSDLDCHGNPCFRTAGNSEHSSIQPHGESASNFPGERNGADYSPHFDDDNEGKTRFLFSCDQLGLRRNLSIDSVPFLPIPEPAMQCVKRFFSYASAEIECTSLKLQILCSLYQITKETNAVQYVLLQEHITELLASNNPFIRAKTLQVVALSLVKNSDRESVLGGADSVEICLELSHDSTLL